MAKSTSSKYLASLRDSRAETTPTGCEKKFPSLYDSSTINGKDHKSSTYGIVIVPENNSSGPQVIHGRNIAISISSECDYEHEGTYSDNIDSYVKQNFSYIPLLPDGKYVDIEEDEVKELKDGQWIHEDHPVAIAVEQLAKHDFLLMAVHSFFFVVENGELRTSKTPSIDDNDIEIFGQPKSLLNEYPEYRETAREIMENDISIRIITLADINKRPVRDMLYSLISSLEMMFQRVIKTNVHEKDTLLKQMDPVSVGRWKKSQYHDVQMHPSEYMNFGEMKKIIGKSDELRSEFNYSSRNQFKKGTKGLVDLRNNVMHSSKTLVRDRDEIESLNRRIQRLEELIKRGGGEITGRDYPLPFQD
ncbi:hypothetical protein ACT4ML_02725 [Natrinema sp. LN54]|uniref:hypothetical protein n=1 Tax=Natrinema sp. LN54 TaxID=3458705 RepID=UPI004035A09D